MLRKFITQSIDFLYHLHGTIIFSLHNHCRDRESSRDKIEINLFLFHNGNKEKGRREDWVDLGLGNFWKKKKNRTYTSSSHLQSLVNFSYSHRRSRFQGKRPLLTRWSSNRLTNKRSRHGESLYRHRRHRADPGSPNALAWHRNN